MPDVVLPGPGDGGGGSGLGDYLVRYQEMELVCGGPIPGTGSCETVGDLIVESEVIEFPPGTAIVGSGEMNMPAGCCEPGGFVSVACCPGPLPTTLNIFFDGPDEFPPIFGYLDLVYDSVLGYWKGHEGIDFSDARLKCVDGHWQLEFDDNACDLGGDTTITTFDSIGCDPLVITGHFVCNSLDIHNGQTQNFIITEGSGAQSGSGDTVRVCYVDLDIPIESVFLGNHYCTDLDTACCESGSGGDVTPGYPRCDAGHEYPLLASPPLVLHGTIELLKCDTHEPIDCPTPSGMDGVSFDLELCSGVVGLSALWDYVANPNPFPVGSVLGIGFELACIDGFVVATGLGPMCVNTIPGPCVGPQNGAVWQPVTVLSWFPFIGYWDRLISDNGLVGAPCCDFDLGDQCVFARVWVYE